MFSFRTLNELKVNGALYQRIAQGKDLVADVLPPPEYIIESYLVTFELMATQDKAERERLTAQFARLKEEYLARHAFWSKEWLDGGIADGLLKHSYAPAMVFYDIAPLPALSWAR